MPRSPVCSPRGRDSGPRVESTLLPDHRWCSVERLLQRKEKRRGGLVFHPKSTLSAAKIVGMLKRNKNVPDFLKKSIAARNGAIVLVGKLPTKPDGHLLGVPGAVSGGDDLVRVAVHHGHLDHRGDR